jgi:hypothetical protein
MASTVEGHPHKEKIVEMILANVSLRKIADIVTPPLSIMALHRYKQKILKPAIVNAANLSKVLSRQGIDPKEVLTSPESCATVTEAVQAAVKADPFLTHVQKSLERRERWMQQAEEKNDFRAMAALDRNDISALELHARLAGRLDSAAGGQISINISVAAGSKVQVTPTPAEQVEQPATNRIIDIG